MTKQRLQNSDYRFIAICLALLAATAWYSVRNFYRAFPEASIDFRATREDAQGLAAKFLAGQGYKTDGYRLASRFSYDDEAKTFMEREAGLEQANRIMGTRVRLWRWSYRWFQPGQKEEYRVDITPAGQFAGFEHQLPEEAARPAATPDQARAMAEAFLRARLGRDPASLDFVEASEIERPHRMDRTFTWKERDFNLRDAANRVEVTLYGNEVAGYREYLKIPEQWTRDYQRLRSKNDMAEYADTALAVALMLGLLATIVMRVRGQDVRWRRAAVIGSVGAALSFLASLNQFPVQEFAYPTTDSYGSFVSSQILQALMAALGYGGLLFVIAAGAEPLYRAAFPGNISLGNLFRPSGLRTKRFFLGAILGVSLTGIFIAYQTVFYIVASRHGAWSPAEVPYDDLLNTRFPWLFVLFGGFFPAVSEEFLFRMFAIPFLRKVTRSLAAAVVLAAFLWGFGHAGYPQQPFYIRGVEVGIGGVALGLIMLRWGILPTLVWHYSVDAMYSAMLLLRSHNLYFRLSGAASAGLVALPVILALAAYWVRGGFEPETGLLNADEEAPAPQPEDAAPDPAASTGDYRPLSRRRKLAALGVAVACLLTLLIHTSHFGESPAYKLTSGEARAAADAFLRERGLNPAAFQAVTYPSVHWGGDDSLAAKYFLERRSVSAASAMFERNRPVQVWATRYFKPLEREETTVAVHPETGKVTGFQNAVPEDRPGADLSPDAARQVAAAFAASRGWDPGAMELKESNSEKKKARRDYTLVWEARPGDARNVEEARYRLEIVVSGDRATSARAYWKLPEDWSRDRERQNAISIAMLALRIVAIAGAVVWALWLLIRNTRAGLIPWRATLTLAAVPALLAAVGPLLSLPLLLKEYPTAIPLATYQAIEFAILAMTVIFAFIMMAAAGALLLSLFPQSVASLRTASRGALALDAVVALALAIGIPVALTQLRGVLFGLFPAQALFSIDSPDLIVSSAPAIAALADAVRSTLMSAASLAVIAMAVRQAPKRWMLIPLALVGLFILLSPGAHTPAEFALQYGLAFVRAGAYALFCVWFARDNYLAYALAFWMMALRTPMGQLFATANPALQIQGWIVAAAMALAVLWAAYPAFIGRPRQTTSSGPA
jgi:membrane protease YdiL (CAAX protease family)